MGSKAEKLNKVPPKVLEDIETRFVRVRARNRGVCPEWHKGAGGKAWIFADEIIIE